MHLHPRLGLLMCGECFELLGSRDEFSCMLCSQQYGPDYDYACDVDESHVCCARFVCLYICFIDAFRLVHIPGILMSSSCLRRNVGFEKSEFISNTLHWRCLLCDPSQVEGVRRAAEAFAALQARVDLDASDAASQSESDSDPGKAMPYVSRTFLFAVWVGPGFDAAEQSEVRLGQTELARLQDTLDAIEGQIAEACEMLSHENMQRLRAEVEAELSGGTATPLGGKVRKLVSDCVSRCRWLEALLPLLLSCHDPHTVGGGRNQAI